MLEKSIRYEDGKITIADDKLGKFMLSLSKETDRALVIIVAAVLDEKLKEILGAFLVGGKESEIFLKRNLQNFDTTNRAAFCLGLISKREYRLINGIRTLRNSFAHTFVTGDFDGTLESKKSEVFDMVTRFLPAYDKRDFKSSREAFEVIVIDIVASIWERDSEIEPIENIRTEDGWDVYLGYEEGE